MAVFQERASKKIDTIFVLALFSLFAAAAFALVLIGAKQYRSVTNSMNENHLNRTISSYLAEKIHQNDVSGAITVTDIMGVPALSITAAEETITYTTYIYYYEESLRELVVTKDSVFSLASGQAILPLCSFEPELLNSNLIAIKLTDANGKTQTLFYSLSSDAEGRYLYL